VKQVKQRNTARSLGGQKAHLRHAGAASRPDEAREAVKQLRKGAPDQVFSCFSAVKQR
jgi:hypothetical protein